MYNGTMLKNYLVFVFIFLGGFSFSQGNINLYKQYNTGPDPDSFYHLWNYSLYGRLNLMNSDQDYTKSSLGKGIGLIVQKLNTKTFGWSTGLEFNEVHYQYDGVLEDSLDNINWLSFPLSIRLFPSRKLFLEIGIKYHFFLNAKNSIILNPITETLLYPKGYFKDTFGLFINIQYRVWRNLNLGVEYQYLRGSGLIQSGLQPNVFNGFSLRLGAFLKNPMKRPDSD